MKTSSLPDVLHACRLLNSRVVKFLCQHGFLTHLWIPPMYEVSRKNIEKVKWTDLE